MIAANRVGKTWGVGAYEMTCHLTGFIQIGGSASGLMIQSIAGLREIRQMLRGGLSIHLATADRLATRRIGARGSYG